MPIEVPLDDFDVGRIRSQGGEERTQIHPDEQCQHKQTEIRFKTSVIGQKTYCRQCQYCGKATEVLKQVTAINELKMAPCQPFDRNLVDSYRQQKYEFYRQKRGDADKQWNEYYEAYMTSPEWRERRLMVLTRDGHLCQGCLSRPAEQVHHLTYDRLGHEPLIDLVSLCVQCHDSLHEITNERVGVPASQWRVPSSIKAVNP